jgi:membrane-associated phospholipid phosphatase
MAEDQQPGRGPNDGAAQDRFVGSQDLTHWKTPFGRVLARLFQRVSRWLGPHAVLVLTLLVGATAAVTLTAVTGEVYEAVVEADGVAVLDHPLLQTAIGLRTPELDTAVTGFTNLAGTVGMPILAVLAMLALSLTRRSWMPVLLIAAAAGGSLLMTVAGKQLTGRARPPLVDAVPPYEYSASFPSGHSLNSIVIAGIVAYLLVLRQRTLRARVLTVLAAAVFALAVGLSRVFLGHHWFTDVLGAWTLGLAWLAVVITAHRLYLTVRRRGTQHRV